MLENHLGMRIKLGSMLDIWRGEKQTVMKNSIPPLLPLKKTFRISSTGRGSHMSILLCSTDMPAQGLPFLRPTSYIASSM